jgi:hypothetical protein
MKPHKTPHICLALVLSGLALFSRAGAAADKDEILAGNWYRTELLIFVRDDALSRNAEDWNPLPDLQYPAKTRFLLDPAMADRRLAQSQAYTSSIDARGVQTIVVPAPIEELLDFNRPDAVVTEIAEPALDLLIADGDPNSPTLAGAGASAAPQTGPTPDEPVPDPNEPGEDLSSPVLALPFQLLADSQLDFRPQARSLRRQGHRVVFHGSWWAPLGEQEQTPSLIIDRSGDIDSLDWPALQGSVQVYLSRYLHINLDLWLNTVGDYLPEGWQIDPPPLAAPSLASRTSQGVALNPWAPFVDRGPTRPGETPLSRDPSGPFGQGPDQGTGVASSAALEQKGTIDTGSEEASIAPAYPWHHAIVHRQSRRMRSSETHYLDHPVIGVILRIVPASEAQMPLLPPTEREFRDRHGLPIEPFVGEASRGSP